MDNSIPLVGYFHCIIDVMADKGGLQLLPETRKRIEVRTPGENRLVTIGLVLVGVVALMYFGINSYVSSLNDQVTGIDVQIKGLEDQRDKKTEENLVALSKQSQLVSGIMSNHLFFTQAFSKLENILQSKIQLEGVQVSAVEQTISFKAHSTSYIAIAKQILAFYTDDGVKDVDVGKITGDNGGQLSFNVSLKLDTNKFFHKK